MYPTQLDLSPEQSALQQTCRKFIENESPISAVRDLMNDPTGFDRDLWSREGGLGWFGLLVPEQCGGGNLSGDGVMDLAVVAGEIGRYVSPGPVLTTNIVASAIASAGSVSQKEELLPRLASGEMVATWCFEDPGWLWDRPGNRVEAVPSGDGFVLQGTQADIPYAHVADHLLVSALTGAEVTQFLIPSAAHGVRIQPLQCLDLTRRLATVEFSGTPVERTSVIGHVGAARHDVAHQLELALVMQNIETVGAVDRVFEFTLQYAKDRVAFGRPIGSYQAIKHRLADLLLMLESCKATAAAAASAVQAGTEDASQLVSVAKAYIGQWAPTIVQECVQVHGGIGLTWDHDIHLYLRRVATNAALYGTPAEHREHLCTLLGN